MPHRLFLPKPKSRSSSASVLSLLVFNTVLLLILLLKVVSFGDSGIKILGFATNISVENLLEQTNVKRQENGLSGLNYNPVLEQAAYNKALDMFEDDYWAHIAPDGRTPWDFMIDSGYGYVYAGENLAKDFNNSSSVVEAWMNSPTHRENILNNNYTEIGFAVVDGNLNGEDTTLVVQMFGKPTSTQAVGGDSNTTLPGSLEEEVVPEENEQPAEVSVVESEQAENDAQSGQTVDNLRVETDDSEVLFSVNKVYLIYLAYIVLGFFATSLFIDGFLAFKMGHLRITGNTVSHVIFFIASIVFIYFLEHPEIL